MTRLVVVLALGFGLGASAAATAARFPDYLVIREHLSAWPRDNGGGRVREQALLARIVDESGATVFEELHCGVVVTGADAEVELALGTVDPGVNPLDLRFDAPWSVRILACGDAACADGFPADVSTCTGPVLLDKPLQVIAYAWRSKYAGDAEHAQSADDCASLGGLPPSAYMPAGTDLWVDEAGDAMTGPLVLSGDPTDDPQAATKKYVDDQIRAAIPRGYAILGPSLASPPGFAPSGAYVATDGEWQTLAPLPERGMCRVAAMDGRLYARSALGRIEVYDPTTDAWSSMAGPPTGERLVALDGKLHVFGLGVSFPPGPHWEVTPATGTWVPKAEVPDGSISDIVAHQGRIYALCIGTLWSWDPVTDTWSASAALHPVNRERTLASFGDEVWVIGGSGDGSSWTTDDVDVFAAASRTWSEGPRLKRRRTNPAAVAVDGRLYVLGGWDDDNGTSGTGSGGWDRGVDTIEVFDPAVGSWALLPSVLPTTRRLRTAAALDGRIHVVGGADQREFGSGEGTGPTAAHEAFTPQQVWYVHVKQ